MGRKNNNREVGRATYGVARLRIPPPPLIRRGETAILGGEIPTPVVDRQPSCSTAQVGEARPRESTRPALDPVGVAAVLNGPGFRIGSRRRRGEKGRTLWLKVRSTDEAYAHDAAYVLQTVARPMSRDRGIFAIRAEGRRAHRIVECAAHLLGGDVVGYVERALASTDDG
ncbi:hypothetical protein ABEG17_02370 [Pedococcus sp. KACC 23699]|uniref:Uncharacterized protein n=1 Tax=Pedococcus sp. KACC 23699 TaxID=3149228 RepID=A0AAU7JV44_9MICO